MKNGGKTRGRTTIIHNKLIRNGHGIKGRTQKIRSTGIKSTKGTRQINNVIDVSIHRERKKKKDEKEHTHRMLEHIQTNPKMILILFIHTKM